MAWGDGSSAPRTAAQLEAAAAALARPTGVPWVGGTGPPTTGAHAQNEIVWNSNCSTTSVIGWVCVIAGTPGVWAAFGDIADAASPRGYGNVWQTDGLNNQQIGGASGYVLAIRDRSQHTGSLVSVDVYQKDDTPGGYSGGNGGSMRLRVETDNAGVNSGSLISAGATVTQTMPIPASSSKRFTLGTPVSDVTGTLRHLVFNNTDASPAVNFVSLNCLNLEDLTPTPLQPTYLDADRACLRSTGGAFSLIRTHYPIIVFNYGDGYSYGVSVYDALSNSGQRQIGSGGRMVRLNFTPLSTVVVSGAHGRVAKRNSSTIQPLVFTLDDLTGGGTVLESASFAAAGVHVGNASADGTPALPQRVGYGTRYVDAVYPALRTLTAGRNYALRMSSAEVTNYYYSFPSRRAASGDFFTNPGAEGFTEGYWEYTTDGVTWLTHTPGGVAQVAQFYLDRVG